MGGALAQQCHRTRTHTTLDTFAHLARMPFPAGTGSGKYNAGGLNGEQLNDAEGLVGTHAYSILDARELGLIPGLALGNGVLGQTRLIKLRNPWGRSVHARLGRTRTRSRHGHIL